MNILKCPCGSTPKELCVTESGRGGKWAVCSGDCCGVWQVEFRTEYNSVDTKACYALAVQAWNEAP